MKRRLFVTGTDTDCGKTVIAAGLLRALAARGLRTVAIKPVAAGCERTADGLRNGDALALQAVATESLNYDLVNPVAFEPPIAPHIAAAESGRPITAAGLAGLCAPALAVAADIAVIEGAGGWRVPLSGSETLADLAAALDCAVVLVVGMKLGCINHAVLSAEAIRRDGRELVGWVANRVDPAMARFDDNLQTLQVLLPAPCLGVVPHLASPDPDTVAGHLEPGPVV